MRYSSRIIFIVETKGKYNPKTSEAEYVSNEYDPLPCNINPISRQRTQLEFGNHERDINVVRLNGKLGYKPTKAIINGKIYLVVDQKEYIHDTSVFIEEVN
ncbi:hypothetical protein V5G65_03655 [Mammaliicoccus sciuri]|uniref:hypothetical protein n=1 Tax=Mammaliicoccus sciuri TaxID=1296 RepID=UPI0037B5C18F